MCSDGAGGRPQCSAVGNSLEQNAVVHSEITNSMPTWKLPSPFVTSNIVIIIFGTVFYLKHMQYYDSFSLSGAELTVVTKLLQLYQVTLLAG